MMKPLHDRVLIKPEEIKDKTDSGVYIPDSARKRPRKGLVVAHGSGTKKHPMTVKIGDTVIYEELAGSSITFEGQSYLMIRVYDIQLIL